MNSIRIIALTAAVSCLASWAGPSLHLSGNYAHADDAWKTEFDDICSKTDEASALPKAELQMLIERCDKLKTRIEALDESARKIYMKRLQVCRDLFVFVLESLSQPN